jgi:hypothetical protein
MQLLKAAEATLTAELSDELIDDYDTQILAKRVNDVKATFEKESDAK